MTRTTTLKTALFTLLAVSAAATAADPYLLFDRFLDKSRIPRMLSTVDFGLSTVQPESLDPVKGDFNGDGKADLAISGVYTLPGKTPDYFLLVVGGVDTMAPVKLFELSDTKPLYLYKPGTTGEGDPGDQSFSAANCINCSTGTDFRWDVVSQSFQQSAWTEGRRLKSMPIKNVDVDPAVADIALRVAGRLRDVRHFVSQLGLRNSQLVTRVEAVPEAQNPARARVLIYERSLAGDELYDAIEVDTAKKRVVRRGEKGGGGAKRTTEPPVGVSGDPAAPAAPDTSR